MRRLVIAVDCDDVLVSTTPFFVSTYNATYGTNATLADARTASAEVWQAEENVVLERWAELSNHDTYKQLRPDPEEAIILRDLAKHHELHLITARKEHERELTQHMLDTELAGVFTSMEFVGWGGSKGAVCERIGADVLIDDVTGHLYDAVAHGLPAEGAILFGEYPWSKIDEAQTEVTRCVNWAAVKARIDTLAGV